MGHENNVYSVRTANRESGEILISSDNCGMLLVWDISNSNYRIVQKIMKSVWINGIKIRHNVVWVLTDSAETQLYLISNQTLPLQSKQMLPVKMANWFDREAAISKDNELVIYHTRSEGSYHQYNLGKERMGFARFPRGHTAGEITHSIVLSDLLKQFFSCGKKRTVRGFNLDSTKMRFQVKTEHNNLLNAMQLIRRDKFLFVGSADCHISLLNLSSLNIQFKVFSFTNTIYFMLSSKDESELVVCGFQKQFIGVFPISQSLFE